MNCSFFAESEEIVAIQLQIDWMEYIAKELPGHNFAPELVLLEKRKMEVMRKIVAQEISKKYPDLGLARAVRHNRAKRKTTGKEEKGKRFKKINSGRLRMTLALNAMKGKAMELETRAHKERVRLERAAGLVDKKREDKTSPSYEKRAVSQVEVRKRPAIEKDIIPAKKMRCH